METHSNLRGLEWVVDEVEASLTEAGDTIGAYLQDSEDEPRLRFALSHIHQVYGSLKIAECYGGALLAEEMEQLVTALLERRVSSIPEACDVLMQAIIKLPAYLRHIVGNRRDQPATLLSLLNDLRAARGGALVSETALFTPDLSFIKAATKASQRPDVDDKALAPLVKKLRQTYQYALLGLLKGEDADKNAGYLEKVFARLRELCRGVEREQLWRAAGALVEGLFHHSIPLSIAVRVLLRELDGEIRHLITSGKAALDQPLPQPLLKNLLYYVAGAGAETPRIQSLSHDFKLTDALPVGVMGSGDEGLAPAYDRDVVQAIADALIDELNQVKKQLERFIHEDHKDLTELEGLHPLFKRIADTLAMVGQPRLRDSLSALRDNLTDILNQHSNADSGNPAETLAPLAARIIDIETALQGWVADYRHGTTASDSRLEIDRAQETLLREVRNGIEKIKEAIIEYIASQWDVSFLEAVPHRVDEIRGALTLIDLTQPAQVVQNCGHYIQQHLLPGTASPSWEQLDVLADAITSIEYYLEALSNAEPEEARTVLNMAEGSVTTLLQQAKGEPAEKTTATAPTPKQPVPSDDTTKASAPTTGESTEAPAEEADGIPDDEFRDIFIEEANEVLAEMAGSIKCWRANNEDQQALGDIRRGFHTLKGSGRMVGATAIGELAWQLENLCNRIIDGKAVIGPAVVALITQGHHLLPEMVQDFLRGKASTDPEQIGALGSQAEAAARGETISLPAPPQKTEIPLAGTEAEQNTGQAPASASTETGATAKDQESVEEPLLAIFAGEAESHLTAIEDFVRTTRENALHRTIVPAPLMRALHTLKGSAHMAGIQSVVALVTPLERFVRELSSFQVPMDGKILALLLDAVSLLRKTIAHMRETPGTDNLPEETGFEARLLQLREQRIGPLSRQSSRPETASKQAIDPTPLRTLMAEGLQTLLNIEPTLAAWQAEPEQGSSQLAMVVNELQALTTATEQAGLTPFSDFCRQLAAAYDTIIRDQAAPEQALLATLSSGHNLLLDMADAVAANQDIPGPPPGLLPALATLAEQAVAAQTSATGDAPTRQAPADNSLPENPDYEILAIFQEEATELLEEIDLALHAWQENADDPEPVARLKRALHTLKGGARMAGLTALGDLSHSVETYLIESLQKGQNGDDFFKKLAQHHDQLLAQIEHIKAALQSPPKSTAGKTPEPPAETAATGGEDWPSAQVLPFTGTPKGMEPPEPVRKEPPAPERQVGPQEMVKISAPVLDTLVNLAGETSIARARIEQQISKFTQSLEEMEDTIGRMQDQVRRLGVETDAQVIFRKEQIQAADDSTDFDPLEMDRYSQLQQLARSLLESASDLQDLRETLIDKSRDAESLLLQQSRINTDLQEGLMRTRMVPFSRLVPRLRRIVRQVSSELGKPVSLQLSSVEGEMDRSVLEKMLPPLEHMIRNAIDHGMEPAGERKKQGKNEEGVITMTFAREGGDILIKLADDGRGLAIDAIREKAIDRDLMKADAALTPDEIIQFIFEPGFSTSATVSQISGRGVGMDVVNSEVRQLGGTIAVATEAGQGTEFTIRLPFTVSVNRALMIEMGDDLYALPLNSIDGVIKLSVEQLAYFYRNMDARLEYIDTACEVRYLGTLLNNSVQPDLDTALGSVPLVLVRSENQAFAVQVDSLLGSQEIVVKTLGPQFSTVPGLSGATVLGDGRVVVILDMLALLRSQKALPLMSRQLAPAVDDKAPVSSIIVVDDSVTVRKVTSRFLEREGFHVLTAKDGVDAMRLLQDHTPHLMLLDIEMPRMDGFEVARLVRSSTRLKTMPIIMITSRTGEKHRERALSMGVNKYLGKPYQESTLLNAVNELLQAEVAMGSG